MSLFGLQLAQAMRPSTKCNTAFCECVGCPQLMNWIRNHNHSAVPPARIVNMIRGLTTDCKEKKCECIQCPQKMMIVKDFLGYLKGKNETIYCTCDGCYGDMGANLVKYLVDVIVKDLNE